MIYAKDLKHKNIAFCVLNWGLGHATRSSVLISRLLRQGNTIYIISEGQAQIFLKERFPQCEHIFGPEQNIRYPKSEKGLKRALFLQSPTFYKQHRKEKRFIRDFLQSHDIDVVISDNRYGMFSKDVPSIFVGHQIDLRIPVINQIHRKFIEQFDFLWIVDRPENRLAGELSEANGIKIPWTYLGLLSNISPESNQKKPIDCLILLSGIQEQRKRLEQKLLAINWPENLTIKWVKGSPEHLTSPEELQRLLSASKALISRSGYSTMMDTETFDLKTLWIPTPGQIEQEYLAKRKGNFLLESEISDEKILKWLCSK
ncbi:hypothetical protein N9L20_04615 [Flavobacteriaceae bacterium]|nr:hypothetical protein [Flavobacteriaceae bacterium]